MKKNSFNIIGIQESDLNELWGNLVSNSNADDAIKRRVPFARFIGIMLRMSLSWDHTEEVNCALGLGSHDEKTWRNALKDIGVIVSECNRSGWRRGCQVMKRFLHVDAKMPSVTALADGSPIPTRALGGKYLTKKGNVSTRNFSGKYGFVAWKFEIWTTCLGVPIAF